MNTLLTYPSDIYGLWYPELEDHYLGVRFLDPDSCLHYGWIRCSIQDTLTRLIVKDFAYESKCDTPIKAGDMVGDTTTIMSLTETTLEAVVYSFGTTVFIQLPAVYNTLVNVYTVEGQMVYSTKIINNQTTQIQLPTCQGIYLIELLAEQEVLRKKVYLQ